MTFLVVLLLLVVGALWSRLNSALREIASLRNDLRDSVQAARAAEAGLRREMEGLRGERDLAPPAGIPPVSATTPVPEGIPHRITPPPMPPVPPVAPGLRPPVLSAPSDAHRAAPAPMPAAVVVPDGVERPDVESLETRIGSRWLLYIGVVAIVFGAAYFVKLAFDNEWITESGRVAIGALAGLALVYVGSRFISSGYALYGQMLSGGGIAVLYVCIYGAFNYYNLISRPVAFTLMVFVTSSAAWLADRQRSQGLALMAIGGGFVTPFLLAGDTDSQVALFTYDATLVAGTLVLARRQEWWGLNLVSYLLTVATFVAWAVRSYTPAKYLTTEIFLTLFCAMFLYVLYETRRARHPLADFVHTILWSAPLIYYFSSLGNLHAHSVPLLVFLIALAVAGTVAGRITGSSGARLAIWAADVTPLFLWIDGHTGPRWLTAGLVTVAGIYLLNLIAQLDAMVRSEKRLNPFDVALWHGNGLAVGGGLYLLVDAVRSDLTAWVVAGCAVWHGAIAVGLARRDRAGALHAGALAFTLLTAAIALAFDGPAVTAAWAAEGSVVIWLGLRERRGWLRAGGALLFAVAVLRLLELEFSNPPVGQMLLLNRRASCAMLVILLTYLVAWAHHRERDNLGRSTEVAVALVAAKLLILALAWSEIRAYWMLHPPPPLVEAAEIITAFFAVGVAIVWLGLRRQEEWVRLVGGVCVLIAALGLLSIQFEDAPAGTTVILNARAAAGAFFVLGLYALAALHRRLGSHVADAQVQNDGLVVVASLFTLSFLTSEINAYWDGRGEARLWSIGREALQSIAWASLGSLIIWLGIGRRRLMTQLIGWGVMCLAVLRLLRLVIADAPPGYVVLANPRVVASAIVVACLYGLAVMYDRVADRPAGAINARRVLLISASALTLVVLTREITAFWDLRQASATGSATSGRFAREVMLSITWAAYATGLIVAGIRKRYAPIRYFAIVIFGVTILKVFLIDLAELDRIYRVLSILGLGVMLLVTSYLYQRLRPAQGSGLKA